LPWSSYPVPETLITATAREVAKLIKSEAGESILAVVIRGSDYIVMDNNVEILILSKDECMYLSNISR
jgi:F420-0:gamma-glutamyl ligase